MRVSQILLADDHPSVLANLCRLADRVGEVVGAVSDGRAAVNESRRLRPDVVVLDLAMPGVGGIEAAQLLRRDLPETKVIICTVHTDKDNIKQAFAAGAVGFVRKQSAFEDLAPAIRAVLDGQRFISPSLRHHNGLPTHESNDRGSHDRGGEG